MLTVIPALICIMLHECSHGLMAFLLGDPTAKKLGRLTLNPLKHIDIIGLAMVLICNVGWAKPVPININNFKKPRLYTALTAMAGPLSNFILAVAFSFIYGVLYLPLNYSMIGKYCLRIIIISARLSVGLCIFNLIPIPPLDGSKIVFALLDERNYKSILKYERYIGLLLFILMWSGFLSAPISGLINYVFGKIFLIAQKTSAVMFSMFYS